MKKPIYIKTTSELQELNDLIMNGSINQIGIDFEGEFNLHRYGIHLCLIQIAYNSTVYIVDAVILEDIEPLRPVLESANIEKIIYACNIDVRLLKHTHSISMKNIFDLRVAATNIHLAKSSLSCLIKDFLDINMEKDKKCQKSDWNRRPLSEEQLEYAANDVLYLIPLRDILEDEMIKTKSLKSFKNSCKKLENEVFKDNQNKYMKVTNFAYFSKQQRIILKHLYEAREKVAEKIDYPPFWVLGKDELVELVKNPPKNKDEWLKNSKIAERGLHEIDLFIIAMEAAKLEINKS